MIALQSSAKSGHKPMLTMANMLTMKPANIDPQAHMVAVSIFHIQSLLIAAEW